MGKRLELYSNNMADHHLVTDLLPCLARLVLTQQLGDLHLSPVQRAILVGMGLEHKVVDTLSTELELPSNQLLALFNRSLKKIAGLLRSILEQQVQDKLDRVATNGVNVTPMAELNAGAAQEQERQQEKHRQALLSQDLMQYAVKGSDVEWNAALASKARPSTTLSIKTG